MLDGLNKFAYNPVNLDINRSSFDRDSGYKTSMSSGKLVPVYLDEVLPGDTFVMDVSFVLRNLTPVVPVMDNSFIDIYFFFVPNRIIAPYNNDDWEEICGANKQGYWANKTDKNVTLCWTGSSARDAIPVAIRSVANYFGFPIDSVVNSFNPYPFIAYGLIYDEWFRDQNTQSPNIVGHAGFFDNYIIHCFEEDSCFDVNKFHDIFTSCLPSPQKGDPVEIGIAGTAPVSGTASLNTTDSVIEFLDHNLQFGNNASWSGINNYELKILNGGDVNLVNASSSGAASSGMVTGSNLIVDTSNGLSNLTADLSSATSITITQLRQAVQIQRMLEKDARGGTRYKEILYSHFGVQYPDMTLQRPQYLGGFRQPINVSQVLQTSQSADDSPLGFTGAFSNTSASRKGFSQSFGEHGYIIGVACIRTFQSYSQGIPKLFGRYRRFDYYWPTFANLSEQPIMDWELYVKHDRTTVTDLSTSEDVFGYQEAWAHYRYKPTMITGALSPNSGGVSFTPWTYTNNFRDQPVLNGDFMEQSPNNVAQTLVDTTTHDQYIIDLYYKCKCVRAMPVHSIPGLMDHH